MAEGGTALEAGAALASGCAGGSSSSRCGVPSLLVTFFSPRSVFFSLGACVKRSGGRRRRHAWRVVRCFCFVAAAAAASSGQRGPGGIALTTSVRERSAPSYGGGEATTLSDGGGEADQLPPDMMISSQNHDHRRLDIISNDFYTVGLGQQILYLKSASREDAIFASTNPASPSYVVVPAQMPVYRLHLRWSPVSMHTWNPNQLDDYRIRFVLEQTTINNAKNDGHCLDDSAYILRCSQVESVTVGGQNWCAAGGVGGAELNTASLDANENSWLQFVGTEERADGDISNWFQTSYRPVTDQF